MLHTGKVKPALAHKSVLDDQERRRAALQTVPGIDFVSALLVAGADRHGVERHDALGQIEHANVMAVFEKVGEHKITRNGTSFL
jgi:hypothetical protein